MLTNYFNKIYNPHFIIIFLFFAIFVCLLFYFYSSKNNKCKEMNNIINIKNLNETDPDCRYTLKDYYINTAYNCCSAGPYKYGHVNICILNNIIKQGVRCLDFEIYSMNDNPVVATSSLDTYNVKETFNYLGFDEVMKTIIDIGFNAGVVPNFNDPIILHLRIKSANPKMYQNFANLFQIYENYLLGPKYSYEYTTCTATNKNTTNCTINNFGDIKLLDLRKKIIIIVDKINNNFMDNQQFYEFVNMTSNSVFMRALNYYDVEFSSNPNELINYNKRNMTIAIPDTRINRTNVSADLSRNRGCQMSAMRYNTVDTNLTNYISFFNNKGYSFVLKPKNLRYDPSSPNYASNNMCPTITSISTTTPTK